MHVLSKLLKLFRRQKGGGCFLPVEAVSMNSKPKKMLCYNYACVVSTLCSYNTPDSSCMYTYMYMYIHTKWHTCVW